MATYVFGDLQGCFDDFKRLLDHIQFDDHHDRLAFVGDLVNRGPASLATLRFLRSLKKPRIVLGNHDIFCLMLGYGLLPGDFKKNTLSDLLKADDRYELLDWLRHQPLIDHDPISDTVLVHAGIPPQWSTAEALSHAHTVQQALQADDFQKNLAALWGDTPQAWHPDLSPSDAMRYTINGLTRMRFCTAVGTLDFKHKRLTCPLDGYKPWFKWRLPDALAPKILFGHWASLRGYCHHPHIIALDTACVWGDKLTAFRLEDKTRWTVSALKKDVSV